MAKVITQEMVQAAADKAAAKATAAEKKRCLGLIKNVQGMLIGGDPDKVYARGVKAAISACIAQVKTQAAE
jgi:hypothetical protein